jgi:sugar (pentulose or hexulose) kinase
MMEKMNDGAARDVAQGRTSLGIELGSTRIKAVLIGPDYAPLASGAVDWESRFDAGFWTYPLDDVREGLRECFRRLAADVEERYGTPLATAGAMGVSAMMHGYLAFGENGTGRDGLLVPFRTWKNTTTERASAILSAELGFNIPQRWSAAHLYQAVLDGEPHVKDITFMTTLAGYVHWKLTGKKVLGIGDASGMFPVNGGDYDAAMLSRFGDLLAKEGCRLGLRGILPEVLAAGADAGTLTEEGAALLDPSGVFKAGTPLCPPEGDAGTGMVATNSVSQRTANVSAGTSIFAMAVLEKGLSKVYPEIDMVATPEGRPAAMVHCNNGTGDIDAWASLLGEAAILGGGSVKKAALYDAIYNKALEGEVDCGGLLSFNYLAGEPVTGFAEGVPLFVRSAGSRLSLSNFARSILFSALASLRIGMDILTGAENVRLERVAAHGGFFKTAGAGQRLLAAALETPVTALDGAGEGGAWGIALLAAYRTFNGKGAGGGLERFLEDRVFAENKSAPTEAKEAPAYRAQGRRAPVPRAVPPDAVPPDAEDAKEAPAYQGQGRKALVPR